MDVSEIVIAAHKSIAKNEVEFYIEDMTAKVKAGFPAVAACALSVAYCANKAAESNQKCAAIRKHYVS